MKLRLVAVCLLVLFVGCEPKPTQPITVISGEQSSPRYTVHRVGVISETTLLAATWYGDVVRGTVAQLDLRRIDELRAAHGITPENFNNDHLAQTVSSERLAAMRDGLRQAVQPPVTAGGGSFRDPSSLLRQVLQPRMPWPDLPSAHSADAFVAQYRRYMQTNISWIEFEVIDTDRQFVLLYLRQERSTQTGRDEFIKTEVLRYVCDAETAVTIFHQINDGGPQRELQEFRRSIQLE